MDRVRRRQPDMSVKTRAFIEPALAQAGVHTDGQPVGAAGLRHVGDVDAEGRIAAGMLVDDDPVDEDHDLAERAVELQSDAAAGPVGRDVQGASVPPDAVLGMVAAQGVEPMRGAGIVLIGRQDARRGIVGQVDRPVVRSLDVGPGGIVEVRLRRLGDGGGLGAARFGVGALISTEAEILVDVRRVAESELPIERQLDASSGLRRRRQGRG